MTDHLYTTLNKDNWSTTLNDDNLSTMLNNLNESERVSFIISNSIITQYPELLCENPCITPETKNTQPSSFAPGQTRSPSSSLETVDKVFSSQRDLIYCDRRDPDVKYFINESSFIL